MRIRPATAGDLQFLAEMLVEAAYPPWIDPKPTPDVTLADGRAGRYLRGWGRAGDTGVVAEDDRGRPIGAAWYRRFAADEPGYGFLAEDVPELAIAVVAEKRGKGIGRQLLAALVDGARTSGERGLSLSVSPENPAALRLYRSAGFDRVGGSVDDPTLVLSWDPGPNRLESVGIFVPLARVTAGEWESLRATRLAALADSPEAFASSLAEEERWPSERWREWAAASGEGTRQATFVARASGGWLGLATGAQHRHRPGAILFAMWVRPDGRRQGIGRRLLEAVLGWARDHGLPSVWLWVAQHNQAAGRLYAAAGFTESGLVDGDAVEMVFEF